ncbi:MAG TPA: phosphodiester glycosidase family protein [Patescibacteria group bacterium]
MTIFQFGKSKYLLLVFVFLLSGCLNLSQVKIDNQENTWLEISPGLEYRQEEVLDETDSLRDVIVIFRIDPEFFRFSVVQDVNNPKTVLDWQKETKAGLVVNGGYFDRNNLSTGLLIINQEKFGIESYDGSNGYTGMFLVRNGQPQLRYLPENNYDPQEQIEFGLQSFPTLILSGGRLGAVQPTDKRARRTVIAQDKEKNILLILTKGSSFSLYDLMNYLPKLNLNLEVAFNLDGGPSTGISANVSGFNYNIESAPVPNVILIREK